MAKTYDLFNGLEPLSLTHLQLTGKELGRGSYATVYEVIYDGMECAGKEIHRVLLEQGDYSYTLRRFAEECRILSRLHHPNIVQFYGVHFRDNSKVPMLIMEFLPLNLTFCIEKRGALPEETSYSILHDVAQGLCYLHSHEPPVIHRDLSSNNVLLNYDMAAKISDFGVARMLNLPPLQVSRMTGMPGTRTFMPPEVDGANPIYDTSVDVFSFGVMMIHIFSGLWPQPQCGHFRIEDDKKIHLSEAERRDIFLQIIGYQHPIMDLILKCIDDIPSFRVHSSDILQSLKAVQLIKKTPSEISVEDFDHSQRPDEEDGFIFDDHVQLRQSSNEITSDASALDTDHSVAKSTSVLAQGLSHVRDAIRSTVSDIVTDATSLLQKASHPKPVVTITSAPDDNQAVDLPASKYCETTQASATSSKSASIKSLMAKQQSELPRHKMVLSSELRHDEGIHKESLCPSNVNVKVDVNASTPSPVHGLSQSLYVHSSSSSQDTKSIFVRSSEAKLGSSAPTTCQHVTLVDDEHEASSSTSSEDGGEACSEDWVNFFGSMWLRSKSQQKRSKSLSLSPTDEGRNGSLSNENRMLSPTANIFAPISLPSQHFLLSISLSERLLWVVDSDCGVYCKAIQERNDHSWRKVKGKMHQISTSCTGKNVWGVYDHNALVRMGIGMNHEGREWRNITKNTHVAHKIKQIAVDETAVWAITTDGKVLLRREVGEPYDEGRVWQEVSDASLDFAFIACCQNVVWAIDTTGRVYSRKGISCSVPSGKKWKVVHAPTLASLSITSSGVVWGLREDKSIAFRCGISAIVPSGTGPWWDVCIDALTDAKSSGVSPQAGISLFTSFSTFRDSISLLGFDDTLLSITASSKTGVVVYEKGHCLHVCSTSITGFHYTPALNNALFPTMSWNHLASSGGVLWLVSSDNGHLYGLLSEEKLARIDCSARIDQVAASPSCVWIMSKDHIWSSSTEAPECLTFEEIEFGNQFPKTHLRHVACGKKTAWVVDANGVPYFRFSTRSHDPVTGMSQAWIPVEDNPQPLLMIAVSPNDLLVWACDKNFNIYARLGVTKDNPVGHKWELIPKQQVKELCADNEKIYAISNNNELICRHGITEDNVQGNYWRKLPGKYKHITIGDQGNLWAMDDKGQVWKQEWTVVTIASRQDQFEPDFEDEINVSMSLDSWEVV